MSMANANANNNTLLLVMLSDRMRKYMFNL